MLVFVHVSSTQEREQSQQSVRSVLIGLLRLMVFGFVILLL